MARASYENILHYRYVDFGYNGGDAPAPDHYIAWDWIPDLRAIVGNEPTRDRKLVRVSFYAWVKNFTIDVSSVGFVDAAMVWGDSNPAWARVGGMNITNIGVVLDDSSAGAIDGYSNAIPAVAAATSYDPVPLPVSATDHPIYNQRSIGPLSTDLWTDEYQAPGNGVLWINARLQLLADIGAAAQARVFFVTQYEELE